MEGILFSLVLDLLKNVIFECELSGIEAGVCVSVGPQIRVFVVGSSHQAGASERRVGVRVSSLLVHNLVHLRPQVRYELIRILDHFPRILSQVIPHFDSHLFCVRSLEFMFQRKWLFEVGVVVLSGIIRLQRALLLKRTVYRGLDGLVRCEAGLFV